MEGERRRLPLLLASTWALSFCLTVFSMELRALHGRGGPWILPILTAALVAAINQYHYGWKSEYLTISLIWNLQAISAAIAFLSLLGFLVKHNALAGLIAVQMVAACVAFAWLVRREHRRIRESAESLAKLDEQYAGLDPLETMQRIAAELQAHRAESKRLQRRFYWVMILCGGLLIVGVAILVIHG